MVLWLCYQTPHGPVAAVTVHDNDLHAAHGLLARLFDHGLPPGGVWYCQQAAH